MGAKRVRRGAGLGAKGLPQTSGSKAGVTVVVSRRAATARAVGQMTLVDQNQRGVLVDDAENASELPSERLDDASFLRLLQWGVGA